MLLKKVEKDVDSAALSISQRPTYTQSLDKSPSSPTTYPHYPHPLPLLDLFKKNNFTQARRYATSRENKSDILKLVRR